MCVCVCVCVCVRACVVCVRVVCVRVCRVGEGVFVGLDSLVVLESVKGTSTEINHACLKVVRLYVPATGVNSRGQYLCLYPGYNI